MAQAEPLYSQNLEIMRRVLGPEHPNTLLCMHNLALVYSEEGKFAQALLPDYPGLRDTAPLARSRARQHAEIHGQSCSGLHAAG